MTTVGIFEARQKLSELAETAYDAAYLELALRLGAPLMTLDGQLRRAAERAGVVVEI